jgi:acetoin utilization deacetylase AcuC-like enzyme
MTLIGPGTYRAARAAAGTALTAVRHALAEGAAYALARPPGHHAGIGGYGGSCYLNNAAVAVQGLLAAGVERVGVVDIDAHHGNGSQQIFYRRGEVYYGSVHVDPAAGWFPHLMGFADETGLGAGSGSTRNLPLPPGAGDRPFVDAVQTLVRAVTDWGAQALVVSLGVDAESGDPESPLQVSADGFRDAGALLAAAGLPTVLVQEGGYRPDTLGLLVAQVLEPFAVRGPARVRVHARAPRPQDI